MLTKNAHPFVMIAIILTAALGTQETAKAQSALTSDAAPMHVAMLSETQNRGRLNSTFNELEYHRQVAERIKGLIYQEISPTERQKMTGTAAIIEVKYTGEGSFEVANVVSSGANRLASTVHRKMVWKALPNTGNSPMNQTTAKMKVGIDKNGEVQLKLELI